MKTLNIKKFISIVLSVLLITLSLTQLAFANEVPEKEKESIQVEKLDNEKNTDSNISSSPDKPTELSGKIDWDDENNKNISRPESITVNLYEDDQLIDSTTTSAENDWNFKFDVDVKTNEETGEISKYRYEQDKPDNYDETSHTDPIIEKKEAEIGKFKKYTPCNELDISMSKLSDSIIIGKLTGKFAKTPTVVIWTSNEINDSDKETIRLAVVNINGIGNPKNYEFYNGNNVNLSKYGMVIDVESGKILMSDPSCWALFAGASYTPGGYITQPGIIGNTVINTIFDTPITPDPYIPEEPPEVPVYDPIVDEPPEIPSDNPIIDEPPETPIDDPIIDEPPESPIDDPIIDEPPETPIDNPIIDEPPETPIDDPIINEPIDKPNNNPVISDVNGKPHVYGI